MADSFTEVTGESWFSRIGGAIKGVFSGIVLCFAAVVLLFWNEGRAVKTYKTLKEGAGTVVSVAADRVDAANEGKLVHLSGMTKTDAVLADSEFGVSAKEVVKLRRVVEMYQWQERVESKTEKKLGGGTETTKTYSYAKDWSEQPVDSGRFSHADGHQNPAMPYRTAAQEARKVTLGAFTLSSSLVSRIGNFEALPVADATALPEALKAKAKPSAGGFYIGADPAAPQVGDLRVSFQVAKPAAVSVISRQTGDSFRPHVASTGKSIEMLVMGARPAAEMFQAAQASNKTLTWILRFVGFIVMLIGFGMIFKPLVVLADVLPFLGDIMGIGTGFISFVLAASISFITIAVAWLFYRPLISIPLLVGVGVLVWLAVKKIKARRAARAAAPAVQAPA